MKKQSGFTLIELSIVITIIGLIVASVIGGQSLVKQSKIRAQVAQLEKYSSAYFSFKTQYSAIPGDFSKASEYWPAATDGDGNGVLNHDCNRIHRTTRENLKFFHHLSASKIIPDNFNGTWQIGVGYPEAKISNNQGIGVCGLLLQNRTDAQIENQHQVSLEDARKQYRAMLSINIANSDATNSQYNNREGFLSPNTMRAIDIKIDDGIAREGVFKAHSIWGHNGAGLGDCLDGIGGNYNLANSNLACYGVYIIE